MWAGGGRAVCGVRSLAVTERAGCISFVFVFFNIEFVWVGWVRGVGRAGWCLIELVCVCDVKKIFSSSFTIRLWFM